MSNYKSNEFVSAGQGQSIPGTPMQQMWHVLNFHEQRLMQVTQHLQKQSQEKPAPQKSEAQQLVEYNTLFEKIEQLTDRITELEKQQTNSNDGNLSLNIEDELENSVLQAE